MVEICCESIEDLLSDGPRNTGLAVQQNKELGIVLGGATKVCSSYHAHKLRNRHHMQLLRDSSPSFSEAPKESFGA